ncbi:MAG: surface lipoprotein assembly modifier [Sphingomicrobium sp.]
MTISLSFLAAVALLLSSAVASARPSAATSIPSPRQTVVTTGGALLDLAEQAVRRGATSDAEAILTLLSNDPHSDVRNEARFRHAKLLLSKGMNTKAAVLLRQVIDENPDATPVRLQLAQVLQALGDTEGAWREVRAAQAAGLPPAIARLVSRYSEALRLARTAGASFEIAIAPDSNINHATRSDTLDTIFGEFDVDQDSKAKPGTGLSLRGQAYRRLPLGADYKLLARASAFANLYRQTSFNDIAVDFAAGPELQLGRSRVNVEVGASARWFGQKPFTRSARLGLTWIRPVGTRSQLRLTGVAAIVDNRFNELQDGKSYSARAEFERALAPTTGVGLSVSADRQEMKDPGYSTAGWRAGLFGWHDLGRATVTAGAEIGKLEADERLLLFPEARSDQYSRFTLGATFRQLTFGGLAPVARLVIERNRSTIEFYDYRRIRTEIGVVRAF